MAEIDRIVVIDIENGSGSGGERVSEQEINVLRTELASTDHAKGAALIGYQSSDNYPAQTVGKAIHGLEQSMQGVGQQAETAVNTANEANQKATDAQEKAINALTKGNNLSDVESKQAALSNIGAYPAASVQVEPAAGKTPKAGSDGTIAQRWVKDLEYSLASLRRRLDLINYPDGNVPYIDWDFTSKSLPPEMKFTRSSIATYINGAGLLSTAGVNEPVFEYSNQGVILGIRKESKSTNLLNHYRFNSEYYIQNLNANIIEDYGIGVDGQKKTFLLSTGSLSGEVGVGFSINSVVYKSNQKYTFSAILKIDFSGTLPPKTYVFLPKEVFGEDKYVLIDVEEGGLVPGTGLNAPESYSLEQVTGNHFRVSITATTIADIDGANVGPQITINQSITEGEGLELDMLQFEEGSVATSIIPTAGTPVTRATETISYEGPVFSSGYGTVLVDSVEVKVSEGIGSVHGFCAVIGNKSQLANYLGVNFIGPAVPESDVRIIGQTTTVPSYGLTVENSVANKVNINRIGLTYFLSTPLAVSVNGGDVVNGTVNTPSELFNSNTINFGSLGTGNSTSSWNGYIRQFKMFAIPKTGDDLKNLTRVTA